MFPPYVASWEYNPSNIFFPVLFLQLFRHYESKLCKALETIYPECHWSSSRYILSSSAKAISKSQQQLLRAIRKILYKEEGNKQPSLDNNNDNNHNNNNNDSHTTLEIYCNYRLYDILPSSTEQPNSNNRNINNKSSSSTTNLPKRNHRYNKENGLELDIYMPSYSLAFEYQGEHHYDDHFLFGSSQQTKEKV